MKKITLLSVGFIIVIFSFSLPLFTGAFRDENFVRCDGCHILEKDEFSRTKVHATIKCTSCHNISEFGSDLYSHNATTHECIFCHTEQNATKFNNDAHSNFSNASNATNIFIGSNEMCVACHTQIELEVEWRSYKGINITAVIGAQGWTLNYLLYGDNVTTNHANYTDYLNRT